MFVFETIEWAKNQKLTAEMWNTFLAEAVKNNQRI